MWMKTRGGLTYVAAIDVLLDLIDGHVVGDLDHSPGVALVNVLVQILDRLDGGADLHIDVGLRHGSRV